MTLTLLHRLDLGARVELEELDRAALEAICLGLHAQALRALDARVPWLELPLSRRAEHVLRRNHLETVGAVRACTAVRVGSLAGCGRMTRCEIRNAFAGVGIALPAWEDRAVAVAVLPAWRCHDVAP